MIDCGHVYVHARPMIDTMSITKSAIGLMYSIHEPVPLATTLLDHPKRRVTYGDALDMMSGLHTEFKYFDFRDIVAKKDGDVTAYALSELMEHSTDAPQQFEYNDLMYQLLASRFPDLRARFAEFMGGEDGWSWETDGAGACLGPHGLSMTPECALAYAERVRVHFTSIGFWDTEHGVPCVWKLKPMWDDAIERYWHGWWLSQKAAYAIGFRVHVIAVAPERVDVQLIKDDYEMDISEYTSFIARFEDSVHPATRAYIKQSGDVRRSAMAVWRAHGRYKVQILWRVTEDEPVYTIPFDMLSHNLDKKNWTIFDANGRKKFISPNEVLMDPSISPMHHELILSADLKFPILVHKNGDDLDVLDGKHRLAFISLQHGSSVRVRYVTETMLDKARVQPTSRAYIKQSGDVCKSASVAMPQTAMFVARVLPPCNDAPDGLREMAEEFTSDEASKLQLEGLPINIEHNDALCAGEVVRQWTDGDGSTMIMGKISGSNFTSELACNGLEGGWLADVSLQHSYSIYSLPGKAGNDGSLLLSKRPVEVSLCAEGARDSTHVITHACGSVASSYISRVEGTVIRTGTVACSDLYVMEEAAAAAVQVPVVPTGDSEMPPADAVHDAAPVPIESTSASDPERTRDTQGRYAKQAADAAAAPEQATGGNGNMQETMKAMMAKIQELADANKNLGERNEGLEKQETERARALEEQRAADQASKLKKSEALLQTLEAMGSATPEQLSVFSRMMQTDVDSASAAIEVAVSCSKTAVEAGEKRAADLQTRLNNLAAEKELQRMWGEQYAGLNVRRASAVGMKRPATEHMSHPAKVPAVEPASDPMVTDTVAASSKITTAIESRTGIETMVANDNHTYNDMTNYAHRAGLIKKTRLPSGAAYYSPTPGPKEIYGVGLMHVNPELWHEACGKEAGDSFSFESSVRHVAERHVKCSKGSMQYQ